MFLLFYIQKGTVQLGKKLHVRTLKVDGNEK